MSGRPRELANLSRSLLLMVAIGAMAWGPGAEAQLLGPLSEEDEIEAGRQAAQEIEKGLTLMTDEVVTGYVAELGRALAARSERSGLDYTFKVVDSAEINAFALPGGFIYVNRGLIAAADNEAELAGVLGHEIGHVVARHGAEQVQRATYANLGLRVLGSFLGRGAGAQIGAVAAEMAATGVFMKFGRDAEREADRLGASNVAAADLDPQGMITFFEKLETLGERQPNVVEQFFASHPQPAERIANVADLVRTLRRDRRFRTESPEFAAVKARLGDVPSPEARGAPVEPAAASVIDPVADPIPELTPIVYEGAAQDHEVAGRFAPVFRQALGSEPRYDYIARFDFDGDWRGDNNWAHAEDPSYRLSATVYYNVAETETHYFIHYAVFHPRDYKGGSVRGAVLSEIMREGVERHGDYDPTGLAQAAVLAHENDMEGALVVVEKPNGLFGRARVVHVETLAHNQFLRYRVGSGADMVATDDEHPILYIEPRGHGIEAYHGGEQLTRADAVVTYRYTGRAGEPTGGDQVVGYDLVSLAATLWPAARDNHPGIYAGTFDYRTWTIETAGDGRDGSHAATLGPVGSLFRGTVGGPNMARPPWGWYDQDEEDQRQGAWFLTPAETVSRHFGLGDHFSTTYVHHPVLGVYRD